jgi:ATP-dependent DNA ligase
LLAETACGLHPRGWPVHPSIGTADATRPEIKHDGYRLIVRRDGRSVRLFTRRGFVDRSLSRDRRHRCQAAGQVVHPGRRGGGLWRIGVFEALHRRRKATDAVLYAFDLLELNGKDIRLLPLGERKAKLAQLLTGCTPLAPRGPRDV